MTVAIPSLYLDHTLAVLALYLGCTFAAPLSTLLQREETAQLTAGPRVGRPQVSLAPRGVGEMYGGRPDTIAWAAPVIAGTKWNFED